MTPNQVTHISKGLECGVLFYVDEIEKLSLNLIFGFWQLRFFICSGNLLTKHSSSKTATDQSTQLSGKTLIFYANIIEKSFLKANGLYL